MIWGKSKKKNEADTPIASPIDGNSTVEATTAICQFLNRKLSSNRLMLNSQIIPGTAVCNGPNSQAQGEPSTAGSNK